MNWYQAHNTAYTNWPGQLDIFSAVYVPNPTLNESATYMLFQGMVDNGFISSDGTENFSHLNSVLKSRGIVLNPIKIDSGNSQQVNLIFFTEQILPVLISQNWLTWNSNTKGYDLTYGDKGLDHTELNIGTYYRVDKPLSIVVISDWVLLYSVLSLQKILNIPKSQMDQLISLTGNKSGASVASANYAMGFTAVFSAVLGASLYSAISTPAVATSTIEDTSYLGLGNPVVNLPQGGVAFAGTNATLTSSLAGGGIGLDTSILNPLPPETSPVYDIPANVQEPLNYIPPGSQISPTSLLDSAVKAGEGLGTAVLSAETKKLIQQGLSGGGGGNGVSQTPVQTDSLFSGSDGIILLGLGFLAFLAINES